MDYWCGMEWYRFWEFYKSDVKFTLKPLETRRGNLFDLPGEYSLAHCVSRDLKMSKGIALQFRYRFGRLSELKDQNKLPGEVAYLKIGNRYIYYLVTKEMFFKKPLYTDIWCCLWKLRENVVLNGVHHLGMPTIACGRDGMEWDIVRSMVEYIFHNVNYNLGENLSRIHTNYRHLLQGTKMADIYDTSTSRHLLVKRKKH